MSELKQEWIDGLASRDAHERCEAASEIYRVGSRRAGAAVQAWWRNPELAQLCGAHPSATVGLAVQPLTFAKIREANDWPRLAQVPSEQDASEFELHFPDGIKLDVLTTREPEGSGAIARFLSKQREGIQQVEFSCADVERATTILRDNFGILPVYPAKRPGADGTQVNFFLVSMPDNTKVLIELYETSPSATG